MIQFCIGYLLGYGLFADRDITKGSFVVEYCGDIITHAKSVERANSEKYGSIGSSYMMDINEGEW